MAKKRNHTDKIVLVTAILNLIFAIIDGVLNFASALARTKRYLNFHFVMSSALYSVFSIIWVYSKPTGEEEYNNITFYNTNDTFCDFSQNYDCIAVRTAKEYSLYLAYHWLFCEVLRLLRSVKDVFSKFNLGKKSTIIAYALYFIPAVYYTYLTCEQYSCWIESRLSNILFYRTIIWMMVVFAVMAMFISVAVLQRKKLASNVPHTISPKVVYFFMEMNVLFVSMETLNITHLNMDIMTNESYESIIAVLMGATNLIWTVYSTWNHGVSDSIRTCVAKSVRIIKGRENMELTDMPTEERSKTEEKKAVETVSYLESHF